LVDAPCRRCVKAVAHSTEAEHDDVVVVESNLMPAIPPYNYAIITYDNRAVKESDKRSGARRMLRRHNFVSIIKDGN
jgi:hypothetical protein